MSLKSLLRAYRDDESGAITIDWVALTSGILLLGIAVVYAIFNSGVTPLTNNINSSLKTAGLGVNIGSTPDMTGATGDAPPAEDYAFFWPGYFPFSPYGAGLVGDINYTDSSGQPQTLTGVTSNQVSGSSYAYTNSDGMVVAYEDYASPRANGGYEMTILGEPVALEQFSPPGSET